MGTTRLLALLLACSSALVFGLIVPPRQQPLTLTTPRNDYLPWDTPPSDNQTDNLIFFRLATLLQHWPNTRYPSGQSVVLGTVPVGTTLYHGRPDSGIPTRPDWLAFDPEHSLIFVFSEKSRLSTFVTTRPLRILYFDGSSAAKMSSGAMDTQDLLAWGKIRNDTMEAEPDRIVDLCKWGQRFGIDGFVRMEMSFEIMHCNFSQGLELVSSLHLIPTDLGSAPPGGGRKSPSGPDTLRNLPDLTMPPPPKIPDETKLDNLPPIPTRHPRPPGHPPVFPLPEPRPPNWKGPLPTAEGRVFEVFQAGSWHNRAPGEVRVKLDAARMVSIYDPALSSGVGTRSGKEKVLHRANGISDEDISTWKGWIENILREDAPAPSGIDWPALATVIMDRYGGRLEYLQFLLDPSRVSQNATAVVQDVRAQLMLMLVTEITPDYLPDFTLSTSAPRPSQTGNHSWVEPIAAHCASFLVSHLSKDKMTREERTLQNAIMGTQAEICRVLSLLWAEAYDPPTAQAKEMAGSWKKRVDELMGWLDWPMWNRCKPECSLDTMCFIPTWPMGIGQPGRPGPPSSEEDLSMIDWTPKCIARGKFLV
ncbi:hypothetical protein RhiJN_09979 [Ceratobasidium sp. AG-Ba]|nr:hypothetical protein RhiJN_09979 [Ceratobasidium sp. AG-Ba]QRW10745.1 hypothetical protein RhiLY_09744 [Ceratobasidium sp. AG-Ba]